MKRIRIIGLALVAVFAISTGATSVASAATPEFTVLANSFTSVSGTSYLFGAGKVKIRCAKDKNKGEVTGAKAVSKLVVTYEECVATNAAGTECPAKSTGAAAGTIVTNELVGTLGKVAVAEAPSSETGLALKPAGTGTVFVTIEGTCLPTTAVEGSVVCEVEPFEVKDTTGELICGVKGKTHTKQTIQKLEGEAKDTLEAFGGTAGLEGTDTITFTKPEEVK